MLYIFKLISFIILFRLLILKKTLGYNDSKVRISMIGDILMHQLATRGSFISNSTYNFDFMFEKFNIDIKNFDINIVNLEILLCANKFNITYFPRFSNRFEIADSLVNFGYNVILKATNHAYDYEQEGIQIELEEWKQKYPDIQVTGAYLTKKDSEKITYITKKGVKIAIINFTLFSNRKIPLNNLYIINYDRKFTRIKNNILKAKKGGAEYIIVCIHWGKEYSNKTNIRQKKLVKLFYKLGVDLVIGTHPHVIQPVEWYKEEDNDRKMLVFYSLGNFINATNNVGEGFYRVFCDGMAYIEIERNEKTKKIETKIGKFVPLITHIEKDKDMVQTYLVKDYSPELAKENRIVTRTDSSYNYEIMINYFKKLITINHYQPWY